MKRLIASALCTVMLASTFVMPVKSVLADTGSDEDIIFDMAADSSVTLKQAFVTRLYENFLGREPDEGGLNYWTDVLENGASGKDIFLSFYNSPEFTEMNPDNEEFMRIMYVTLLDREPDTDGLNFWVNHLDNGFPRTFIADEFMKSPEFEGICAAYEITSGVVTTTPEPTATETPTPTPTTVEIAPNETATNVHGFVERLYIYCKGRTGTTEEVEYWYNELKTKDKTAEYVALRFFNLPEFTERNMDNAEFLTTVYMVLFNRNIEDDTQGYRYWLNKLTVISRDKLISALISDSEFKAMCDAEDVLATQPSVRELYPQACAVLDRVGWNLNAAMTWCVMTYQVYDVDPNLGTRHYADYGFRNHRGNCYVMAACFKEMALALGYDAQQVSGVVPLRRGGWGPHSWVLINGLIYDPDFQLNSGISGMAIVYGTPGTWVYKQELIMHD